MYKYDVSSILKTDGAEISLSVPVDLEIERLSGLSISEIDNCWFEGTITNNAGFLTLKGILKLTYTTYCGRCLKTLVRDIALDINEGFSKTELYDKDDIYIFKGTEIPLGEALTDNFIINVPAKSVCREDCKGLCPVCGTDLNVEECSCNREYIDPRLKALKSFLKDS